MRVWRPQTAHALRQDGAWDGLAAEVGSCATEEAVDAWWADFLLRRHRDHPEAWTLALRDLCEQRQTELAADSLNREMDAAFAATIKP